MSGQCSLVPSCSPEPSLAMLSQESLSPKGNMGKEERLIGHLPSLPPEPESTSSPGCMHMFLWQLWWTSATMYRMFFLSHLLNHHSGGHLADGISCTGGSKILSLVAQLLVLKEKCWVANQTVCCCLQLKHFPWQIYPCAGWKEKMTQGLGDTVSCLKAEIEEGGQWCVLGERQERDWWDSFRRSWERHFHVLSTLESLKWCTRPAGPSQIIDLLVQDTFSNPHIN